MKREASEEEVQAVEAEIGDADPTEVLVGKVRAGLCDGCEYACGCDHPGEPASCMHVERFSALDVLGKKAAAFDEAMGWLARGRENPGRENSDGGTVGYIPVDVYDRLAALL